MAYKQPIDMPDWLKVSLRESFRTKDIREIRHMSDKWLRDAYREYIDYMLL